MRGLTSPEGPQQPQVGPAPSAAARVLVLQGGGAGSCVPTPAVCWEHSELSDFAKPSHQTETKGSVAMTLMKGTRESCQAWREEDGGTELALHWQVWGS